MRHTYSFRATPTAIVVGSQLQLTPTSIGEAIGEALVHQFSGMGNDTYDVEVQVQQPSHYGALNNISCALQGLGYSFLEAEVSEWATMSVELGYVGSLGGGSVAGIRTRSLGAGLLVGIFAGVAGALAGQVINRRVAAHRAQFTYGHWRMIALPLPAPPVIRAFAAAVWG